MDRISIYPTIKPSWVEGLYWKLIYDEPTKMQNIVKAAICRFEREGDDYQVSDLVERILPSETAEKVADDYFNSINKIAVQRYRYMRNLGDKSLSEIIAACLKAHVDGLYGCNRYPIVFERMGFLSHRDSKEQPVLADTSWLTIQHYRNPRVHPFGGTWNYDNPLFIKGYQYEIHEESEFI